MRKIILLLLLGLNLNLTAQTFEYRSAENPYYWKNRMPDAAYWQQDVHYKINARLDDSADIVEGFEILKYYNNSPDTLWFLYFHLYQNAFVKGSYLESLNKANHFKQKFGKYENTGKGTEIIYLAVNEVNGNRFSNTSSDNFTDGKGQSNFEIDNSIMKVVLPEPLLPNASCELSINFKTYFDAGGNQRRRMKMFTDAAGNKQYDGVHWYPRICVYDRKFGWETDQHLGKEFYGDFGQFEVAITLPNNYLMEATGELQNEAEMLPANLRAQLDIKNFAKKPWEEKASTIIARNGSFKTWKYRSVNTHDFAWTADPTYRYGEVVLSLPGNPNKKVRCIALVQEPHASGWQDAAFFTSKIIETYSRDIGVYAYPKMVCADARDGMEYPMLTLDGGSSPGYYGLIAHEVGHNWFFGMVGNNETYRASLDEGFTQFLTHWSMSRLIIEKINPNKKSTYINKYFKPMPSLDQTIMIGYIRDAINENDVPLNTHSDDFNGALNHGGGYGHVYYKTATMLYNLQYVLGNELFLQALQHYFNQWKICHPYFEDFRASIMQYTHTDLNWFFDQWLETTKRIDYGFDKMNRINKDSVQLTFSRKGSMQMPVDFDIINKDLSRQSYIIPNTYFAKNTGAKVLPVWKGWGMLNPTYTVTIPYKHEIRNIVIDPTTRLADINQLNNSLRCPVLFTFDHQLNNPLDRRHYILKWRPDIWYNNFDGIKAGLHVNGNYMNQKHVFKFTVWYNKGIASNFMSNANILPFNSYDVIYQKSPSIYPFHYSLSYKHRIAKFLDINFQSRLLDGIFLNRIGLEKTRGNTSYRLFVKSMQRHQLYYLPAYQPIDIPGAYFYPNLSSYRQWNNTLNIEIEHAYKALLGSGKLLAGLKTNTLFSDFDYATAYLQIIQNNNLSKFEIRTRLFGQIMTGSNFAPESQLYLAGANPEEMIENKYTRSAGVLPAAGFLYGTEPNYMQAGGGLNLRGYAGYLMPVTKYGEQYFLYRGNSGASVNIEMDYDKFIPFKPRYFSNYLHIDSYLFFDAGFIRANNIGPIDGNNGSIERVITPILACGGAGFALTIKKWGILEEIKPLTIRFDMPLYLSNAPYTEQENFKFRYQFGIQRCF
ncbi:MAG: M1 family aminopeptidase [Bacteroidota bacterium]|nr:M1 family aminopeptidase [Bacteroidota bacterium]